VILAGGMVRGGYYGDVFQSRGGGISYQLRLPDPNSGAVSGQSFDEQGQTGTAQGRLPAGSLWKAVARASGVPAAVYDRYPAAGGAELRCLFRA
jgi:hypothetical protein